MTWIVTSPIGISGIVTVPCWLVLVSQFVMIFFIFTGFNPWRNRTITLARSIGLPVSTAFTWTVSFVPDPPNTAKENSDIAKRTNAITGNVRMASLCDIGQ